MTPQQLPTPPESSAGSAHAEERLAARDLFNEAFAYVLQTLRRLGIADSDRDDLAQEIVIAAFLKRQSYDPERGSLRQWLYGFTVNYVCNYRRMRSKRRGRLVELPPDLPARTLDPESRLQASQLREFLHKELVSQLPFEMLTVVVARELDEFDFATIASQQQLPLSTVYDRYTRGMAALRSAYQRHLQHRQAHGLAVLPFALEQLLAADRTIPPAPPALVRDTWRRLQRAHRWRSLGRVVQSLLSHPAATFVTGGVFGVVLQAALPPIPPVVPVVTQQGLEQRDPEPAPRGALAASDQENPFSPSDVLPTRGVRSAPGRDLNEDQRAFDKVQQAFDRRRWDEALAALAAYEHTYPAGAFLAECKDLRAKITQARPNVPARP